MTVAVLALTLLLAAANGGNDNGKGVATLGGAGVTRYRSAILWGSAATFAGALASLALADRLIALFSTGIVTSPAPPRFALAVLIGATAWVALATALRLPVSTTHAIVGALIGAALVIGPHEVAWSALTTRVVGPLLLSAAAAYALSAGINAIRIPAAPQCVCLSLQRSEPASAVAILGSAAMPLVLAPTTRMPAPVIQIGSMADCRVHRQRHGVVAFTTNGLHWLSAASASFARGLNDTPKITAIGAFALVPAGMATTHVGAAVAAAMAAGGLVAALRVAPRLGDDIVSLNNREGTRASVATALLVGVGAARGVPLSLTHVSAGAIAGAAGTHPRRLRASTIRQFTLAWTITPAVAASIAAFSHAVLR